jgi:hypothetical protein
METPGSPAGMLVEITGVSPDTEGLWRVYAIDETGQGWFCRTGNRVRTGDRTTLVLSVPGAVDGTMLGAHAAHASRRMPI